MISNAKPRAVLRTYPNWFYLPAALVFCAQRSDVHAIAADASIDPAFARALRSARRAGVIIAGLKCAAHPLGMELLGSVPVL